MQNKFDQFDSLVSSSLKYRSLSSINVNWLSCLSKIAQVHSNSVVCKYMHIFCYNCGDYSYQDKQGFFSRFILISISKNFIYFYKCSAKLTAACFVLFAIEFSSVMFITSSETLKKCLAVVLKFSTLATLNHLT